MPLGGYRGARRLQRQLNKITHLYFFVLYLFFIRDVHREFGLIDVHFFDMLPACIRLESEIFFCLENGNPVQCKDISLAQVMSYEASAVDSMLAAFRRELCRSCSFVFGIFLCHASHCFYGNKNFLAKLSLTIRGGDTFVFTVKTSTKWRFF